MEHPRDSRSLEDITRNLKQLQEDVERGIAAKKRLEALAGFIGLFLLLPVWYFLMYTVLKGVNAPAVAWVLFYFYIPMHILNALIMHVVRK